MLLSQDKGNQEKFITKKAFCGWNKRLYGFSKNKSLFFVSFKDDCLTMQRISYPVPGFKGIVQFFMV
jgi:hypothetical protein